MLYKSSITRGKVKASSALYRCSACGSTSIEAPEAMACPKCGAPMIAMVQEKREEPKQAK